MLRAGVRQRGWALPSDRPWRSSIHTHCLRSCFRQLTGPKGGSGVIVPTGIATDATTAPFFAALVDERRLAGLIDFENRDALFPAVHRSFKFSLLTLGRQVAEAHFWFFLTDPKHVEDSERGFRTHTRRDRRDQPEHEDGSSVSFSRRRRPNCSHIFAHFGYY